MPNEVRSVQIVVPVRGAHEALKLCLACLRDHTPKPNDDVYAWTTIVVDASEREEVDSIVDVVGIKYTTTVITSGGPYSFAKNVNAGASRFQPHLLVILNSDAFVGPGWLDELLAPFADPDVVAVGPMGTNVSGHQGVPGYAQDIGQFGVPTPATVATYTLPYRGKVNGPTSPYRARRLVGFCLAVRRSAWDEVGGFDERFENAFCDDDLSLRLNLVGDCVVVPDLLVLHAGSASFAELPDAEANYARVLAENEIRFNEKWKRRGLFQLLNAWFDYRGVR